RHCLGIVAPEIHTTHTHNTITHTQHNHIHTHSTCARTRTHTHSTHTHSVHTHTLSAHTHRDTDKLEYATFQIQSFVKSLITYINNLESLSASSVSSQARLSVCVCVRSGE